jgi:hypothetical protein
MCRDESLDDDWDDWNRPGNDPWSMPPPRFGGEFDRRTSYERNNFERNSFERNSFERDSYGRTPAFERSRDRSMDRPTQGWGDPAPDQWRDPAPPTPYREDDPWGDR